MISQVHCQRTHIHFSPVSLELPLSKLRRDVASCCVACNRSVESFRLVCFWWNISSPTRLHGMVQMRTTRTSLSWLASLFFWNCSSSGFPSPIMQASALTYGIGASQTRMSIRGRSNGSMCHGAGPGPSPSFMGLHVWSGRLAPPRRTGSPTFPVTHNRFTSCRVPSVLPTIATLLN
jgi:hypothetical protein